MLNLTADGRRHPPARGLGLPPARNAVYLPSPTRRPAAAARRAFHRARARRGPRSSVITEERRRADLTPVRPERHHGRREGRQLAADRRQGPRRPRLAALRSDNALVTAAEAVRRIAAYQPKARILDVWRRYVDAVQPDRELAAALMIPSACWTRPGAWRASASRRWPTPPDNLLAEPGARRWW